MEHDQLKCGNCGSHTFLIYNVKNPLDHRVGGSMSGQIKGSLLVACTTCHHESTINVAPSAIVVEGELCGGWL